MTEGEAWEGLMNVEMVWRNAKDVKDECMICNRALHAYNSARLNCFLPNYLGNNFGQDITMHSVMIDGGTWLAFPIGVYAHVTHRDLFPMMYIFYIRIEGLELIGVL